MLRLDTAFTLIEGARVAPENPQFIDVAAAGVAGVIRGLMCEGDVFIMRDPAAPPPPGLTGNKVWLQTSGTTGAPKWIGHFREALCARISPGRAEEKARWLLTFNPGSFAGLQVILSVMAGGHALIVPEYGSGVTDMADLAVRTHVTHISATPTFWRAFLMVLGDRPLDLKCVTLGGEAADQALLDALQERFPQARLRHIYATTEAGTVFSVRDGRAGFPRVWLNDALSVTAHETLAVNGFDTGDIVELTNDRVLFCGRLDAMVNIGGVKVYPEAVEAYMLQLSFIRDVRVSAKPSPITGHMLVADIVLKDADFADAPAQIKAHLLGLPRAQRPASLRFVDALDIGATGKKSRS